MLTFLATVYAPLVYVVVRSTIIISFHRHNAKLDQSFFNWYNRCPTLSVFLHGLYRSKLQSRYYNLDKLQLCQFWLCVYK